MFMFGVRANWQNFYLTRFSLNELAGSTRVNRANCSNHSRKSSYATSRDEDIFKKACEYLQAGTKLVWAVYTDEQVVHVIRLNEDGGLTTIPCGLDSVLDGGEVLPGFQLPVREIFPA